jgi:maleate isomerase
MNQTVRLGVLTPSSNTALEPLTSAIAALVPGASAHFSRFQVTEIALDNRALGQFDDSKILAAACASGSGSGPASSPPRPSWR